MLSRQRSKSVPSVVQKKQSNIPVVPAPPTSAPITTQPSLVDYDKYKSLPTSQNESSVDAGSTIQQLLSSLHAVLDGCNQLFLKENNGRIFQIQNGHGELIFTASYDVEEFPALCDTCKVTVKCGVYIADKANNRIITTRVHPVKDPDQVIRIGYEKTIGNFHFQDQKLFTVTRESNHLEFRFVPNSRAIFHCPCTVSSFQVKSMSTDEQGQQCERIIGEVHMKWQNKPKNLFGFSFPLDMELEDKVMIVASSIILYTMYFCERRICCCLCCNCHIGRESPFCVKFWSGVIIAMAALATLFWSMITQTSIAS